MIGSSADSAAVTFMFARYNPAGGLPKTAGLCALGPRTP